MAQAKIGRPPRKDEEAHHIDHDPLNPHPDDIGVRPKKWNRREGSIYMWLKRTGHIGASLSVPQVAKPAKEPN